MTTKSNKENVILKVITQEDYDRNIFVTYDNDKIVGINYHQGIDDILTAFLHPCPTLTNIFNRLNQFGGNEKKTDEEKINKAIDLYRMAFIEQRDVPYSLNKNQRSLIQKALKHYVAMSEKFNSNPTEQERYNNFDMMQLAPMFNYPIEIVISEEEKIDFSKYGIDFPM